MTEKSKWSGPEGFLAEGWIELCRATEPYDTRALVASVLAPFASWGAEPPEDVRRWLAPLENHAAPPLAGLQIGSHAPASALGNLAEQRIVAAQGYPPLWCELFHGAFELGSTRSGDIWMCGFEPFKPAPSRIYLYNHESGAIESPEAHGVEPFVLRAALCGAHEARSIDEATYTAAFAQLSGHVGSAYFEDEVAGFEPFKPVWGAGVQAGQRSEWLIALLSTDDLSDAEIRSVFALELNPPLTEALLAKRAPRIADFPPIAFYTCFVALFSGDDAMLARTIALAAASRAPIVRDLAALITELAAGRTTLGKITDLPALRARVAALRLWDPRPTAAFVTALAGDPALAPELAKLDGLQDDDGYRNEDAIAALVATGDRRLVPALIEYAIGHDNARLRVIALDVLAEWAEPSSVEPVLQLAFVINRFHTQRFAIIRLVHGTWDARHAAALCAIARRFPPRPDDRTGDEMRANLILALADLGDPVALDVIRPLINTAIDGTSRDAPIGLDDAVAYALAELGDDEAWPGLAARARGDALYRAAGLAWAVGPLAARQSPALQAELRARLDACRISRREIQIDDQVQLRSIASLFDEQLGGQLGDLAHEIALEHSRVVLGAPDDALRELVTGVLSTWSDRSDRSVWTGYDATALLCWALSALRHHPALGRELARPYLTVDVPLARLLARRIVATAP